MVGRLFCDVAPCSISVDFYIGRCCIISYQSPTIVISGSYFTHRSAHNNVVGLPACKVKFICVYAKQKPYFEWNDWLWHFYHPLFPIRLLSTCKRCFTRNRQVTYVSLRCIIVQRVDSYWWHTILNDNFSPDNKHHTIICCHIPDAITPCLKWVNVHMRWY